MLFRMKEQRNLSSKRHLPFKRGSRRALCFFHEVSIAAFPLTFSVGDAHGLEGPALFCWWKHWFDYRPAQAAGWTAGV